MRDRKNDTRDRGGAEPLDDRTDAATLELDAADHELVDRLRALPPDGDEPDWKKLEAAIRAEVSPLATPAPWWRNWRWLVPIGALATTAAIVMTISIRNGGDNERASANRMTMRDASVDESDTTDKVGKSDKASKTDALDEAGDARDLAEDRAAAVWLDGEPADLDELSPDSLDALEDLERDMLADLRDGHGDVSAAFDELGRDDGTRDDTHDDASDTTRDDTRGLGGGRATGVLPAADYQWIDTLRDDEATRLENFLARKRS